MTTPHPEEPAEGPDDPARTGEEGADEADDPDEQGAPDADPLT